MLEVVDAEGRVLRLATRAECHSHPSLIHRSVCVLVYDPDGRLYLQRRSMRKDLYAGMWDLSATGHVRPTESWEAAARRELHEELGIEARLEHVLTTVVHVPQETELAAVFRCRHGGPMQLDPHEVSDGRFVEPSEVAAQPDLTPYAVTLLRRVLPVNREPR